MFKALRWLLLRGLLLALVLAGVGAGIWNWWVDHPNEGRGLRVVEIAPGSSPRGVARRMKEEGLVSSERAFYALIRLRRVGPDLKAGTFRIRGDSSPEALLHSLRQSPAVGDIARVTLPEGWTFKEMAQRLDESGVAPRSSLESLFDDAELLQELEIHSETLEGYLYPDTYEFYRGESPELVLRKLVGRWKEVWSGLEGEAAVLGWSANEVVTLASIVEKETGNPGERAQIAGVFRRRLDKGMLLQADPTIIYGLRNYDGNIRRKDIRDPHPWNTYVHVGLPPTPICSPGREAMEAVLRPDTGSTLYFVARADGTGRHDFSTSYAEHARKVRKYRP